jgi:uncharacterized lipoprotein YbaY
MSGHCIRGVIELRPPLRLEEIRGWVRLEEVSLADAPAEILAESPLHGSATPLSFQLQLQGPADAKASYALRARLSGRDETGQERIFGTTERHAWSPAAPSSEERLVVNPW